MFSRVRLPPLCPHLSQSSTPRRSLSSPCVAAVSASPRPAVKFPDSRHVVSCVGQIGAISPLTCHPGARISSRHQLTAAAGSVAVSSPSTSGTSVAAGRAVTLAAPHVTAAPPAVPLSQLSQHCVTCHPAVIGRFVRRSAAVLARTPDTQSPLCRQPQSRQFGQRRALSVAARRAGSRLVCRALFVSVARHQRSGGVARRVDNDRGGAASTGDRRGGQRRGADRRRVSRCRVAADVDMAGAGGARGREPSPGDTYTTAADRRPTPDKSRRRRCQHVPRSCRRGVPSRTEIASSEAQ